MKTNANYITLSLSQILFIALITLLAPNINAEIKKEHKIEDNGFEWYKLWDTSSGSKGAIVDGRTIIPLERRYYIIYWKSQSNHPDGGYFYVIKNGYDGAVDVHGREIIAPNKYELICWHDESDHPDGGYFGVKRNGYDGAVDLHGREIIAPNRYVSVIWSGGNFEGRVTENSDFEVIGQNSTSDYYASNSTNTSHNSSTSSSSSSERQLIAQGVYTISQQGQSVTTGNFTGVAGPDIVTTIEFYSDGITVNGLWCEYAGTTSNGKKKYSDPMSFGGASTTYYVDNNYNVLKQTTYSSPFGTDIFNHRVVKGEVSIPKAQPYTGSGSYSGSGSQNHSGSGSHGSHTYQKDCHLCHGSGKCSTCNGKHYYLNPLTGKYITCPNCKPDGACSACGGTGKKRN